MFSSRTGQCEAYNSITSLAAPFVKRNCFEPAFLTPLNDANSDEPQTYYESYFNGFTSDRGCGFDTANASIPNKVQPLRVSYIDNRNSLWRRENSVVVGKAPRDFQTPNGQTCPQQPYYVIDETGKTKVVCPILTSLFTQPQCNTCLTTVFQCERFKEVDPAAYAKCEEYKRKIHYDVVLPNGSFIPTAVEMDNTGYDVYHAAVQKCGIQCSGCSVYYPAQNFEAPRCGAYNE